MLGLLAATTWGAADFAGGLATRRAPPSRVVLIAHGVSFLLLAAIALTLPLQTLASLPTWTILGGLLSGVTGGAALMLFYKALSIGAMGLSAAIAGLLTAVLPVVLAIRTQGAPAPLQIAGFTVAALSIVLIAYTPAPPFTPGPAAGAIPSRRALLFATLSGAGFGLQLVWLHTAAAVATAAASADALMAESGSALSQTQSSTVIRLAPVLYALLLSRFGGAAIALATQLASRPAPAEPSPGANQPAAPAGSIRLSRLPLPALAALAGLLDASGNGLYMLSSLAGRLDVAAVLSSLYPGGTILLAAIFLRERATRLQALGMGFALVAVALIAA